MIVVTQVFMYMSTSWVSSIFSSMLYTNKMTIKVLPSCITDRPPKLLTPPPLTVRAVQRESVTIKAVYKGNINEDLLAYWCVTTLDDSRCIFPTDNDTTYQVTTDGCPPTNVDCCYFSVSIHIKSLTLNLSQANLTSEAVWLEDPTSFNAGNSTLGMDVLLECFIVCFCSGLCIPYSC